MYDLIRNILIAKKCDLYIVIIFLVEKTSFFVFFFFLGEEAKKSYDCRFLFYWETLSVVEVNFISFNFS